MNVKWIMPLRFASRVIRAVAVILFLLLKPKNAAACRFACNARTSVPGTIKLHSPG